MDRNTIAAQIMAGFAANPNLFGVTDIGKDLWSDVDQTKLTKSAFDLADELIEQSLDAEARIASIRARVHASPPGVS